MANSKQKKANLKKGLLGRATGETTPIIVQENNVLRVEKELDQSRAAKAQRKSRADEQKPASKLPKRK